MTVACDYGCGPAVQVGGDVIYPHRPDLRSKLFWRCPVCEAYVGCHPDGRPLGGLANAELREARMEAHAVFDPFWKRKGIGRSRAYRGLAKRLGIDVKACHIGMFDVETCRRVIEVVKAHHDAR